MGSAWQRVPGCRCPGWPRDLWIISDGWDHGQTSELQWEGRGLPLIYSTPKHSKMPGKGREQKIYKRKKSSASCPNKSFTSWKKEGLWLKTKLDYSSAIFYSLPLLHLFGQQHRPFGQTSFFIFFYLSLLLQKQSNLNHLKFEPQTLKKKMTTTRLLMANTFLPLDVSWGRTAGRECGRAKCSQTVQIWNDLGFFAL